MSEENDLLFFTGFEGCRDDTDARNLFTSIGGTIGGRYPELRDEGFLGGKAFWIRGWNGYGTYLFNEKIQKLFFGAHLKIHNTSSSNPIIRILGEDKNINIYMVEQNSIKIERDSYEFDVFSRIELGLYFHFEIMIDTINGEIKVKINGITELNEQSLDLENDYLTGFELDAIGRSTTNSSQYYDNIWIHKSKSLGQAIALLSQPDQDGHYNDNFHTHDEGSGEIYPYLETNDGDDSYIYSSVPDAKFTCNFEDIPEGFTPLAFAVQKVFKHTTGGGLLYVQDFARLKDEDYSGEYIAPPDVYEHSYLFRTNYSGVFNGFELNRENINSGEFGIKLIEL